MYTYSFCGLLVQMLGLMAASKSHEDQCSPVGLRGSCPCRRLSELKLEDSWEEPVVSRLKLEERRAVWLPCKRSDPLPTKTGQPLCTSSASEEPDDWDTVSQISFHIGLEVGGSPPLRGRSSKSAWDKGQSPARARGVVVHSLRTDDL